MLEPQPAEAVVLEDDTRAVMAVLPASQRPELRALQANRGHALRLAIEVDLQDLYIDSRAYS
ncbi:MAG: hypothetical protein AAB150_18410 [Pseudomonadota bacterium]